MLEQGGFEGSAEMLADLYSAIELTLQIGTYKKNRRSLRSMMKNLLLFVYPCIYCTTGGETVHLEEIMYCSSKEEG